MSLTTYQKTKFADETEEIALKIRAMAIAVSNLITEHDVGPVADLKAVYHTLMDISTRFRGK